VALGSPDPTSFFYDSTWNVDRGYEENRDVPHIIDGMVNYELDEQNLFTFGSSFETETLKDNQPAANRSINESFDNLGFIAQYRWKPIEVWTLEYGIRGDFNSEIKILFSLRALRSYCHLIKIFECEVLFPLVSEHLRYSMKT
jgi:outer membrane receptor for ferrienterochelin and colicin